MTYSFTEKKRIRKSFANAPAFWTCPTSCRPSCSPSGNSCRIDAAVANRKNEGLQAAFHLDFSDRLAFRQRPSGIRHDNLGEPAFDVVECAAARTYLCGITRGPVCAW